MNEKYVKKYTVGCGDMDINYHLTKIAAVKFFQETFALNCAKNNVAAFDVIKQNMVWVISDLHVQFLGKMPYWSEEFEVEMWISEKTKLRTYSDFKICYRGHLIAQGDSCWYLLDMETRRPVKTDGVLDSFAVCDEKVFGSHEKHNYLISGREIAKKEHQVTVRDLDFNYHVNNLSYIGLALETIPPEYLDEYCVFDYKVKFVQEARLSDVLVCEIFENGRNFDIKINQKSDNSDVCFISALCCEKTETGRNPREAGIVFE